MPLRFVVAVAVAVAVAAAAAAAAATLPKFVVLLLQLLCYQ